MARLKKSDLIKLALQAIGNGGWAIELLTEGGEHPARFRMSRAGVEHLVRLYIWNLSHGGKSRSKHEFRIQITGIDQFEPEPKGRTLILGWGEEFGVFAAFDLQHRLGALGSSPSIQITDSTLKSAAEHGGAAQDKGHGERAVAVRPSRLGSYVESQDAVHAGNLSSLLGDATEGERTDLEQSLIDLSASSIKREFGTPGEKERRNKVIAQVDSLLGTLEEYRPTAPAQIGHNLPPEAIYTDIGVAPTIEQAAKCIRDELAKPEPDAAKVGKEGAKLARSARLLEIAKAEGRRLIEKGKDLARDYAAKALWGSVGTSALLFKEEIVVLLRNVAEALVNWLQHISIF